MHRRGSFTGATDDHRGFFEMVAKGTLFLDEIGELGLAIQAKVLRLVPENELVRFGDSKPRKLDVRVIAATNRSLDEEVQQRRFRADLLYRLKVFPLRVSSLRERREDLPVPELSPEALRALMGVRLPGQRTRSPKCDRARASTLGTWRHHRTRGPTGIPAPSHQELESQEQAGSSSELEESGGLLATVARYEREQIALAPVASGANPSQAARTLGIRRRWLLKRLERYRVASSGDGLRRATGTPGLPDAG